MESIFTNFWVIVGAIAIFFGITDIFKHLGNRLDKRRGMEIYRELMKERFEVLNNAVRFGADATALAELNRILEKFGDMSELRSLVEIKVSEDSDEKSGIKFQSSVQLPARDLAEKAGEAAAKRQREGGQQ